MAWIYGVYGLDEMGHLWLKQVGIYGLNGKGIYGGAFMA